MIDFSTLQGLAIPEGVVTQIEDASGRVIWMLMTDEPFVIEVAKITSDTYAGETTYTGEQFILLDIYPKTNKSVSVTYGGLTKTITDTSGVESPNMQQVFFGTFNGVSDSVATPSSGTLTIEGGCAGFGIGTYKAPGSSAGKTSTKYCSCITSVKDNEISMGQIPDYAFYNCDNLTQLTLNGVKNIGGSAFVNTAENMTVTINGMPDHIEGSAFIVNSSRDESASRYIYVNGGTLDDWCDCGGLLTGMEEYESSLTPLHRYWYYAYINGVLTTDLSGQIELKSCKRVSNYAFYGCNKITSVILPSSVTSIDEAAFYECTGITSIAIPNSVTSIGDYSFYYCKGLTNIELSNSLTSIGMYAFAYCSNCVISELPNSLISIGDYAFIGSGITINKLPNNIKSISSRAFESCSRVTISELPNSLTSISAYAFYKCTGITSITIHNSITSIGAYAFDGNPNLSKIIVLATTPPSLNSNGMFTADKYSPTIIVPVGCGEAYRTADGWSKHASLIVEAS